MESPYRFVAYRGRVDGAFTSYNYVLLDSVENGVWKDSLEFMNDYWKRSRVSNKPVVVRLPGLLQVRVGSPVLSLDAINKGQRTTNFVWYDSWTDNLCTFDYSKDQGPERRFVCVLDKSRVPGWLRSGCYSASYCVECPRECWVQDKGEDRMIDHHFAVGSGACASIVVVLEKYEKALGREALELHAPPAVEDKEVVGPFPRTVSEFVESFRLTFRI